MDNKTTIYLDTPVTRLMEDGIIDRTVMKACDSAKPPMVTAGDILSHFRTYGNFVTVPGCRRPGRISDALLDVARQVVELNTPDELKPRNIRRQLAGKLSEEADFEFLTDDQRAEILSFKNAYGSLPMFRILKYYFNRPDAGRNDILMSYALGLNTDGSQCRSLADVAQHVELSRERIRQIIQAYTLPPELMISRLWTNYVDHSTYFVHPGSQSYLDVCHREIPELTFPIYADILGRVSMLENIEGKYLARRGWTSEIDAWYNRLSRMAEMPRRFESRISLEGLAMGGSLDTRISIIVLNQIAPACGLLPDAPDGLILPKNCD